ncbi:glycosyltransferase family 4 protein [Acinetobacter larvae]|uniref:Glycosyltransferase family 1 protein n=1 Tax=Acinetobacter larvae TaxID=1789224 RepID=A0A1B2LVQ3_9GAMM|nr:glycosyltransferase family 4 protein [Acinetobacter larvae]AOA56999.1 glycosyltransferase family 1 protein [Acinetobacter larvae]
MHNTQKVVLIGTTAASIYGFRRDLILQLIAAGHEVYTFISEYQPDDLLKIAQLGAKPCCYPLSRGGLNPFADLQSFYYLVKHIRQIKPDIVLSYFAKPVIYGTLAAKFVGVAKVIAMLEGLGYTFTERPEGFSHKAKLVRAVQIFLYRLALPRVDDMIFLNSDDQHDLVERYALAIPRCHVLGGIGLNLKHYQFSKAPIDAMNFLFIGRLLREKGIFEFIEAIRIVKARYPHVSFTVLGGLDAQNMGALSQATLTQLVAEQLFTYPGHVADVRPWIEACSVFVLPSYREGVPRSTQEAMAMGRAIISTDVAGCRETVIHGQNGFLVPAWDAQALAEQMCYFVENPEMVAAMGLESYKIAQQRFDVAQVNLKIFQIMGLSEFHEKIS